MSNSAIERFPRFSLQVLRLSAVLVMFAALAWLGARNYLLFHSLTELFSVIVAAAIFLIAWNARDTIENGYLLFLGIAFLSVSAIDLAHMLAFKGMGVFPGFDSDLATQLWIAGRAIEASSLVIAPLYLSRSVRPLVTFVSYAAVSVLVFVSIFWWRIFPACYVEGQGLTGFKIAAEYAICLALAVALARLLMNRRKFRRPILLLLCYSIGATILSELAFTKYASVYGDFNLIGHLLKIISVVFIYKAIVETGFRRPYELMYRNMAESERKFRSVVESNVIGVLFTDPITGTVNDANDEYLRIIGRSRADLEAGLINWKALTPPEILANEERMIAENFEQKVGTFEKQYIRSDGSIIPVIIGGAFLDDNHRQAVVFVMDNTARKRAEDALRESERQFRIMGETLPYGVWLADPQGEVQYCSQSFLELLNMTQEEQLDFGWTKRLVPEDVEPTIKKWLHCWASGTPWDHEHRIIDRDGAIHTVLSRGLPVHDSEDRITCWVGVNLDITQRKKDEQNIKEAKDRAEKIAAELARSNKELEQFAYIISHDLQEPLRTISGFLTLLSEHNAAGLDEKSKKYISFSIDGARRMSQLIKDLLEYSRVGNQKRTMEPIDAGEVFKEAKANCIAAISEADALVTCGDMPHVKGDRRQLVQLFQNLIGNSVKFRRPQVRPEVNVTSLYNGHEWIFKISDNGIGIPENQAGRLFQLFQRLHGRNQYGGTGIGLALCRKIVELHDGRIWIESEQENGTTVLFTLPAGDSIKTLQNNQRDQENIFSSDSQP